MGWILPKAPSPTVRRLAPLFAPLREALLARSRTAEHWHADETRWQVFEASSEHACQRWCLWVFWSAEVVVFTLPSKQHFATVTGGVASTAIHRTNAQRSVLRLGARALHHANERDDQKPSSGG